MHPKCAIFAHFWYKTQTHILFIYSYTHHTHTKHNIHPSVNAHTQTAVTFYQLENHFCPLSKLKNTHVLEHPHIPSLTALLITVIEIVQCAVDVSLCESINKMYFISMWKCVFFLFAHLHMLAYRFSVCTACPHSVTYTVGKKNMLLYVWYTWACVMFLAHFALAGHWTNLSEASEEPRSSVYQPDNLNIFRASNLRGTNRWAEHESGAFISQPFLYTNSEAIG